MKPFINGAERIALNERIDKRKRNIEKLTKAAKNLGISTADFELRLVDGKGNVISKFNPGAAAVYSPTGSFDAFVGQLVKIAEIITMAIGKSVTMHDVLATPRLINERMRVFICDHICDLSDSGSFTIHDIKERLDLEIAFQLKKVI